MNSLKTHDTGKSRSRLATQARTGLAIFALASVGGAAAAPGVSGKSSYKPPTPPTNIDKWSPIAPAMSDVSRLSPETQRCFDIALSDTVLGITPTYANKRTTRKMKVKVAWQGMGSLCARAIDAELVVVPTVEKNHEMVPAAKSQRLEVGSQTTDGLIAPFNYTNTRNECVPVKKGSNRGIRELHVGAIVRAEVTAPAADGIDANADGKIDTIVQNSIYVTTRNPEQNPCIVTR